MKRPRFWPLLLSLALFVLGAGTFRAVHEVVGIAFFALASAAMAYAFSGKARSGGGVPPRGST
jgi:hypothetical protein